MIASAKALVLAFVMSGAFSGGAMMAEDHPMPLEQAKEIHEDHLGADSTLPDQAIKGQQTAYDHIVSALEKWLEKRTSGHDASGTNPQFE